VEEGFERERSALLKKTRSRLRRRRLASGPPHNRLDRSSADSAWSASWRQSPGPHRSSLRLWPPSILLFDPALPTGPRWLAADTAERPQINLLECGAPLPWPSPASCSAADPKRTLALGNGEGRSAHGGVWRNPRPLREGIRTAKDRPPPARGVGVGGGSRRQVSWQCGSIKKRREAIGSAAEVAACFR